MTQEHITITEEVVKNGQLVTQERETLQTTTEAAEAIKANPAYGITHPGYVSAQDRVYTYNEETGMSESEPAEVIEEVAEEPEEEDAELDEDEEDEDEDSFQPLDQSLCLHPVGNGECQLPANHSGAHKLSAD